MSKEPPVEIDVEISYDIKGVHYTVVQGGQRIFKITYEPEIARDTAFSLTRNSIACEELREKSSGG